MTNQALLKILFLVFMMLLFILMGLVAAYLLSKRKKQEKVKKVNINPDNPETASVEEDLGPSSTLKATNYTRKSIFDFMSFDSVEDNMIIQKNEKRFLMILECQGVNYDLMSNNEKIGVEEGFLQFLNTLRQPIQIYIQTRAVNLTESINVYKQRIEAIGRDLEMKEHQLKGKRESGMYTQDELDQEAFEVFKQRNLYTYGKDIIFNTEQMSLNKNILTKKYYIVIPYSLETNGEQLDKEEVRNLAFSELYTRARSMINVLATCDVKAEVLDTMALVELLYEAYNRDEAEIFSSDRAMMAGYNALNITAQDVITKKMREIDKEIDEKAILTANRAILQAKSELEKKYDNKMKSLDDLIEESALRILEENKSFVGPKTAELAQEKIKKGSAERRKSLEEKRKLKQEKLMKAKEKKRKITKGGANDGVI